ncbi:MAG TPA: hypothetical protein VF142_01875, partial [Longimicrobium sp.]
ALLSVLLVVTQLAGGTTGEIAALVAVPVAAAAAFAADRRYLPVLLVLAIPSMGIVGGRDAAYVSRSVQNPFVFAEVKDFVVLAGVEVTAPLAALLAGFGRVAVEVLAGGGAFRGVVPRWLVTAFMLSLVPVLAGGLQGQAQGYNRWSQGVRAMLVIGGFLWGVVVARRGGGQAALRVGRQIAGIMVVAAALLAVGLLRGMLLFLAVGLVAGVLPSFLARRRMLQAGVCVLAVAVVGLQLTLTTLGTVLLALACVALSDPRARGVGRWLLRLGVLAGCVLSGLMIWAVVQLRGKTLVEVATREEGVMAYAVFKLMGDRGPLWLAAVEQIMGGPYLVVPAGRPLRPESFDYGGLVYTWESGAHNAVLELLRNVGLIGGAAGLALAGWALLSAVRLLLETRDVALRGVAAGFVAVAIVGSTTGNFPVYDVGFFLWGIGGILAGARLYAPRRGEADETPGDEMEPEPAARARPTPRLGGSASA